jgi:dCTP deaminase
MAGVLSHKELVQLVSAGVIENCPLELVNGASIDITLAETVLTEVPGSQFMMGNSERVHAVDFRERTVPPMLTIVIDKEFGFLLGPGDFVLASSQQLFNLPVDLACEYKLKSSMARIGLNHLNAGWCDPTWHGSALTLELVNVSRYNAIRLRPGDRIGQMVFFRCAPVAGAASYAQRGRYNGDKLVSGIKP